MNLLQRLAGTLLLRPSAYRDVAENGSVVESLLIVSGLALLNSATYVVLHGWNPDALRYLVAPPCAVAVLSFFASMSFRRIYRMDMPITRIFQVLGYAAIFTCVPAIILTLLDERVPLAVVALIAAISWLTFVAYVIGIREAARVTTGRAMSVMFFSFMITGMVVAVLGSVFSRMG